MFAISEFATGRKRPPKDTALTEGPKKKKAVPRALYQIRSSLTDNPSALTPRPTDRNVSRLCCLAIPQRQRNGHWEEGESELFPSLAQSPSTLPAVFSGAELLSGSPPPQSGISKFVLPPPPTCSRAPSRMFQHLPSPFGTSNRSQMGRRCQEALTADQEFSQNSVWLPVLLGKPAFHSIKSTPCAILPKLSSCRVNLAKQNRESP